MTPLRIHLQLIGMVILWGASWPWGRVVAQAMPTFIASSVRFFLPLFHSLFGYMRRIVSNTLNNCDLINGWGYC